MTPIEALQRAVQIIGGQAETARAIRASAPDSKVAQGHIYYWLTKPDAKFPAEYCAALEVATTQKGEPIFRAQLRPDVFGLGVVHAQAAATVGGK